jgi:hypothetical protein
LTWNPLWGATSYNIKRSNVSGGPYAVISPAGSVTTTNYLDTAVTNGGTYYYAISASSLLTEAGETANGSAQGMVTLPAIAAAPQVGWNSPVYTGMTLQLTASAGAGASYNWTGPNGFSSTSQNPVLAAATVADSGLYTVVAFGGGVASAPATVNVLVNPPVPFTVHPSPDGLIFNWPYGLLESATNISGPWVNLTGANSPYTNPVTAPQGFFRVQLQ